ncbi:MAG TPA: cupin domain-containing protein [Gemmatimonadales bacterium]|jgi:mannose-6-phosphate isomerase-like protein (cupin superfamily)|nr:cupin domain-containing protein [Gemmatimonadales bacterium]
MDIFELPQLFAERPAGHNYFELIRVAALSAGLYVLQPGEPDKQAPHREDELYYVVGGRATIRVGAEDRAVAPGSAIFVPAGVEHHFHSIQSELRVLVIFAPAETLTTT